MAFNELIKSFDNIRQMMRDFYVFGFKSRADFADKSARSYDNERRRIESWLSICIFVRMPVARTALFPWTAEKSGIILFTRR